MWWEQTEQTGVEAIRGGVNVGEEESAHAEKKS